MSTFILAISCLTISNLPCEEGNGKLLQYSCLENSMDRGAWLPIVYGLQRVKHNLATGQQFTLIRGLNIPGSQAILFFQRRTWLLASDTSTAVVISALIPLFILSRAISPLFPSSMSDICWPGRSRLSVSSLIAFSNINKHKNRFNVYNHI